jgi:hypothetical protein
MFTISALEGGIRNLFRERDTLMDSFDANRDRIQTLELAAAALQRQLAPLVDAEDPARAKRLRTMADAAIASWRDA